jgi:hypothetical protein
MNNLVNTYEIDALVQQLTTHACTEIQDLLSFVVTSSQEHGMKWEYCMP